MNVVVGVKEIARAFNVTARAVQMKASDESWPCVSRKGHGGAKYFELSSLPADVRLALADVAASEAATAGRKEALKLKLVEELAGRATHNARVYGLARCIGQDARRKARIESRAALVSACNEFIRSSGLPLKTARELFSLKYNVGEIQVEPRVRELLPHICGNTLANWTAAVESGGILGLAGKYGQHRRGSGKVDADPELRNFVMSMLSSHPHCDCKHIMRGLQARYPEAKLPGRRALQRWVGAWKEANQQLHTAKSNPDKWRSRYKAAGGNASAEVMRLNQRWEIDSTPGDVMLSDGKRHNVVGVIDVYSRRMKLYVSRSSSAVAVAALLRRALMDWGVPEVLVTDNGSDFTSKHINMVLLGLEITPNIAPPFTPEHKPHIERAFGTFSHDLMELLEGFVGHNVAERKDIEARRSFAARMTQKGQTLELRMTADEFQAFCDRWTDDVYAHDAHDGLSGKTPWQMATEWALPISRISDERALDILLAAPAQGDGWRTLRKKGLKLPDGWYEAAAMGGHEGERVKVLLDEADAGQVYVFCPSSGSDELEFLCKAVCPEITGVSRQELSSARRAHQKKVIGEGLAELKKIAQRANTKNIAREILAHRAELAGKLTRLPQASTPYETESLRQAGYAAQADEDAAPSYSPAPDTAEELARKAGRGPDKVVSLPDAQRARFMRWKAIDANNTAGFRLSEEDEKFWFYYRRSSEFSTMLRMEAWEKADQAPK